MNITNITVAAIPPAMYANSDRSVHFGPVNEPLHLQAGVPLISLTHCPEFSQKLSQTSKIKTIQYNLCS